MHRQLAAEPTREDHRATPLELFFDVVYVFAFTQVTHLMSAQGGALGMLQGLAVFGVLWWSWASYAWLANQVHAQHGIGRIGILAAVVLVFVLSLAIPATYHDRPGALLAPLVFAVGYIGVCIAYTLVNLVAAGDDARLRSQVIRTMGVTILLVSPVLLAGALLGGTAQIGLWLAAVIIQGATVFLTSHGGEWRLPSAAHYAERHQLVVILALGESVVSIGAGAAEHPVSAGIVVGAVFSIVLAAAMWWNYFHRLADVAERAMADLDGVRRTSTGTAGTYLHLGIVGGILLVALGLQQAMQHVESMAAFGFFGAGALGIGLALNLAASAVYWWQLTGQAATVVAVRLATALISVLLIPALAAVPAFAAIALAAAVCVALAVVERVPTAPAEESCPPRAEISSRAASGLHNVLGSM